MDEESQVLRVTESAAARVRALLAQRKGPALGVRVGVKRAGCNDMSYTLEFAEDVRPGDEVIAEKGVTIVVDAEAILYLVGSEMDFVNEKLASRFVFNNPNETGRCGCGESFKID